MYERCLVPIDGSDLSYRALKEAVKILNVPQGRVRLVYVVPELLSSYPVVGTQARQEWSRTEGRNALAKAEALARELGVQTESALLKSLLGPTLGMRAQDVPDLGVLLVGPMTRGAEVSLR